MSVIPELEKLRQENHWFEANLSYTPRLYLNTHTHTQQKHQRNRRKGGRGREAGRAEKNVGQPEQGKKGR